MFYKMFRQGLTPASFQADAVRNEQAKVLRAIQPLDSDDVLNRSVRGQ